MPVVSDLVDYKFASLKEAQQKTGCYKWDRGAMQEVFGYGTWAQFFYYLEMYPNTCYGDAPLPPFNSP